MKNNIDRLIKRFLENRFLNKKRPIQQNCPDELELNDFLEKRLNQERQDIILEHIADCPHCLSLLEIARKAKKETGDTVSPKMIKCAKDIIAKQSRKSIWNYKWVILASVSFILSFIFTQYFLQFLILAVILSLKWVFDTGSTRTLIMIYESWRKKEKDTARRIIDDFRDKIEQRK